MEDKQDRDIEEEKYREEKGTGTTRKSETWWSIHREEEKYREEEDRYKEGDREDKEDMDREENRQQ